LGVVYAGAVVSEGMYRADWYLPVQLFPILQSRARWSIQEEEDCNRFQIWGGGFTIAFYG
jgi:hypothetical protein